MLMTKHQWYKEEKIDLLKSWIILSLAFAILMTGLKFNFAFFVNFVISSITVGTAFLLHELAHKFVAEKYRCKAVYKADPIMLGITLISSLLGFIFAAPGAVYIIGSLDKRTNGIISLAGPLTNIVMAFGFLLLILFSPEGIVNTIAAFGFFINGWLAAFNMLPFGVFDGKKIWNWNKTVYIVTVVVAVGLVFSRFTLL